jgi:hypothetical protein
MAKDETESAIVATNKTIDLDGQLYGPGEKIVLDKNEAASLRAKGFLENPDAVADAASGQPKVKITKGDAVKSEAE